LGDAANIFDYFFSRLECEDWWSPIFCDNGICMKADDDIAKLSSLFENIHVPMMKNVCTHGNIYRFHLVLRKKTLQNLKKNHFINNF